MPAYRTVYYKADAKTPAEALTMFSVDAREACRNHPKHYTKHNPDGASAPKEAAADVVTPPKPSAPSAPVAPIKPGAGDGD